MTNAFKPDPTDALSLLAACPSYAATPLRLLPQLAEKQGWASLVVKDETVRMGLGSFKALGGVYAVANILRQRLGNPVDPLALTAAEAKDVAKSLTVCCASAGNHGLSVATGARIFGAHAVVYLADSVPEAFAMRLRDAGAEVVRAGAIYEDAMAQAMRDAKANDWQLVSDTSWDGYVEIPTTIMQGYCVMAHEMAEAFRADASWPTHVFLQAGVGGLAGAVAGHIRAEWDVQPEIIVVEPDRAPCLKASAAEGRMVRAEGAVSNMGRLDCKEPSMIAFGVLHAAADSFVTVSDEEADRAVELLEGEGMASTPSGTAGLAAAFAADLPENARVLVIVSEGKE